MNNLDFLNQNSLRNYPIKDTLSRVSTDELFTIPNDFIVDISISSPGHDTLKLFVSKIVNSSINVYIELSVAGIVSPGPIGSFNVPLSTAQNTDIAMVANAAFPGARGIVTIGTLDSILAQPSGEFTFTIEATELLMRVYSPSTSGLNYLAFTDAKGNRVTLTGHVTIQAESNLQFRPADSSTVFMNAGDNLGLNTQCDTSEMPIKTINGVRPDSLGNFYLIGSECIQLDPVEYGLLLKDTCGKPCLGCNEIGTLTDRLVALESDLLKVRDYVNNLQGLITQLTTLVNYQCQCE